MAATINFYNYFKKFALTSTAVDMVGDTIKLALCSSSYVPDIDTHIYFDDITNELSGGGYTAGGNILDSVTLTVDTTNDRIKIDANDESFASLSGTNVRTGVIYSSASTAAASPLIAYVDFGENKTFTNGTLTFTWHANGIGLLT